MTDKPAACPMTLCRGQCPACIAARDEICDECMQTNDRCVCMSEPECFMCDDDPHEDCAWCGNRKDE